MVFLTPDDDTENEGISPFAEGGSDDDSSMGGGSPEDSDRTSELDTGQLSVADSVSSLGAADKVELDLEDAPFLEEEEEEEAVPEEPEPLMPSEALAEKESFFQRLIKDKKLLLFSGAGLIVFLAIIILVAYLLWPAKEAQLVEEETPTTTNQTTATAEEEALPPEEPEIPVETVTWEPFWVEYVSDKGEIRFLHAKFSATTENQKLAFEIGRKQTVLRDAIFYYLRNKDLTFLADQQNVEALKRDLLSVINQYLTAGQLQVLLIEEYLIK